MKLTTEDREILKNELAHYRELFQTKKIIYEDLKSQLEALMIDIYKIEGIMGFLENCLKNGHTISEQFSFRKIIKENMEFKESKINNNIQKKLNGNNK